MKKISLVFEFELWILFQCFNHVRTKMYSKENSNEQIYMTWSTKSQPSMIDFVDQKSTLVWLSSISFFSSKNASKKCRHTPTWIRTSIVDLDQKSTEAFSCTISKHNKTLVHEINSIYLKFTIFCSISNIRASIIDI